MSHCLHGARQIYWSGEGADFRFAVPLTCAGVKDEGFGATAEIDDRRIGGDPGLVQQGWASLVKPMAFRWPKAF